MAAKSVKKGEILITLDKMNSKAESIIESLTQLSQIELGEAANLNQFGGTWSYVANRFNLNEAAQRSQIYNAKLITDLNTIKTKIFDTKRVFSASMDEDIKPEIAQMYLKNIIDIVKSINEVGNTIRGKEKDTIQVITDGSSIKTSLEAIIEIDKKVQVSGIEPSFKENFRKNLWNGLWKIFDMDSLHNDLFNKIKIFQEKFLLTFLEVVSNDDSFKQNVNIHNDFIATLDKIQIKNYFEKVSIKNDSEIRVIFRNFLISNNLESIYNIYESKISHTISNNSQPQAITSSSANNLDGLGQEPTLNSMPNSFNSTNFTQNESSHLAQMSSEHDLDDEEQKVVHSTGKNSDNLKNECERIKHILSQIGVYLEFSRLDQIKILIQKELNLTDFKSLSEVENIDISEILSHFNTLFNFTQKIDLNNAQDKEKYKSFILYLINELQEIINKDF